MATVNVNANYYIIIWQKKWKIISGGPGELEKIEKLTKGSLFGTLELSFKKIKILMNLMETVLSYRVSVVSTSDSWVYFSFNFSADSS